jgi:alginate O-acetyltransferase complex protein AlgI
MLFSSLVFLFYFLPAILLIYYLSPRKARNSLLLIFSLVFYAWGGVSYTIILILSLLFNFFFARRINKTKKRKWLIIGLIFNISLIVSFKYLDFFIENINVLTRFFSSTYQGLDSLNIILPLGISFFTFQQMSLLWDTYRNPENKKIRFLETALYISFFPQLIAGPIVRYKDIIQQIRDRKENLSLMQSGIRRFILGLFKKVIFANTCAVIADNIMDMNIDNLSSPVAWLGIIAYSFQIYFDFSGYSDMAIGLGRIFGFRILENFNFPYISKSIQEFWRRWHISLSTWFRDYVYIPLGGNRKGIKRTYINLLIVFLLTGFWHGATWSFVFWGAFHGLFLIIERIGFKKILGRIPNFFSWTYTILVVIIGWVFFRIEYLPDAFQYVGKLFSFQADGSYQFVHILNTERIIILSMAAISSTLLMKRFKKLILRLHQSRFAFLSISIENIALLFMFLYSVMYINSGSYNPFIYFRF